MKTEGKKQNILIIQGKKSSRNEVNEIKSQGDAEKKTQWKIWKKKKRMRESVEQKKKKGKKLTTRSIKKRYWRIKKKKKKKKKIKRLTD